MNKTTNNVHPKRGKLIEALRANGGRMQICDVRDWGVRYCDLDDMLEKPGCVFKLQFEPNGIATQPRCFLVLKDYSPPKVVSQQEIAAQLNRMTEIEYRNFLLQTDSTLRARLQRRGYRRRGISADTYLHGNGDRIR